MHWHIGKWFFPRQISLRNWMRAAFGVTLLAAAASASAQHAPDTYSSWEFTPFYGYMAGGEFEDPTTNTDRDLDADNSFGLFIDAAADEWRHYELIYTKQGSSIDGAVPLDLDVEYLQIGGTVMYQDAQTVIPYFGMTIGGARLSPDGPGLDDETKFAFSVGGGFKVPVTDHFGVRFDARAFVTLLDSSGNVFCVSDNGVGTCGIRAKSDTFVQYQAALGVIIGF
ncbi:outer membrane beta-barrel protein [Peristeroidobacter agariperforans]|uniref:outer membrane beta-barrel protein n=1 Tax=Peristeroidobacter agariperforans TaxID=268404 RepID=UPI00101DDCD7|nr:outer membrane beta-barrel protein [Peristeroidobacter agariperforans]